MGYARKAKASDIGYKRGRKSTTVDSRPPSNAYRARYDLIDWSDGGLASQLDVPKPEGPDHDCTQPFCMVCVHRQSAEAQRRPETTDRAEQGEPNG